MDWYATRHDDYSSPIIKGMRRINPKERARTRIFSDDELRIVWKAAEANGSFGAFVRLLLLTGQRRDKVATMRWEDIQDGVWLIPSEKREKGNATALKLPQVAIEIINAQPRFASNPFVFAGTGRVQLQESHDCQSCIHCQAAGDAAMATARPTQNGSVIDELAPVSAPIFPSVSLVTSWVASRGFMTGTNTMRKRPSR